MTPQKAWFLLRRSSDKQEKSIPEQRQILENFAAAKALPMEETFLLGKQRNEYAPTWLVETDPEFQRMLRLAETRPQGGRLLLIHDVSRSGRLDPRRKIYYEEHLRMRGVHVLYVTENFKHDGSVEDGLIQYLAHYRAKDYRDRLSKDTFRGMDGLARMGRFCGGRAPYGFARMLLDRHGNPVRILHLGERKSEKAEHVTLVLNPDSSVVETARWIFVAFDQGTHIISIVNALNARKVPAPKGGIWTKRTIREILANPVYVGTLLWNKRKYLRQEGKALVTFNADDKRIRKDDVFPAILEKPLFERVQERLKMLKVRRNSMVHHFRTPSDYPLTGGTCTHCGKRFGGQCHKRKKKDKIITTAYYECMGSLNGGVAACPNLIIPKGWLQEQVAQAIKGLLPAYEDRLLAMVNDIVSGAREQLQDVRGLERRAAEIDVAIQRIMSAIESGLNSEEGIRRVNDLRAERDQLKTNITQVRQMPVRDLTQNINQIRERIRNFDAVLTAGTPDERRAIYWAFVDRWEGDPNARQVDVFFKTDAELAEDFVFSTGVHYPRGASAETGTEQAPATNLDFRT